MKKCCRCQKEKPVTDFNKKSANKDGFERYCKDCHRIANRKHYCANKGAYIAQSTRRRKEMRVWFKELKSKLLCERCGNDKPWRLMYITN